MFPGQSLHGVEIFSGPKYFLVQSILWSKIFSGSKYSQVQRILCSKVFSRPKYSLGWSVFEAKVCLGPKWVWDVSYLGIKLCVTLESGINIALNLLFFFDFFQGLRPYSGLHKAYFSSISIKYKWGYAYSFCQNFQGLRLLKGLRLFRSLEYLYLFKCFFLRALHRYINKMF